MPTHSALIGGMKQESNTFVPFRCGLRDFREGLYFAEGAGIEPAFAGRGLEISGFYDVLRPAGWEIIPTVAAEAVPSGPVEAAALDWFLARWLDALRAAGHVDAVLLALHGATVAVGSDDACGVILEAIRRRVGADVFIGATYDLHANITRKMLLNADALFGYHTYPHVDQYEVGAHVAQLAVDRAGRGQRPALALCKVPMLVSPAMQNTPGPFGDLLAGARALEAQPGILGVSLFPVQPWMDVPELGFAALVVTDGDPTRAQREADRLGRLAWAKRHEFDLHVAKADEAIRQALATDGGPVVLADLGDGPGGGAGGDSTALLRAMLEQDAGEAGPALLSLTDGPAVDAAFDAGLGRTITVTVGDKVSRGFYKPTSVTGKVVYMGTPSYSAYKAETSMGLTAVLDVAGIFILLTQKPVLTVTPDPFEAVGLDPRTCKMVVAKSGAQFREKFEPFARRIIFANTPGPCSSDFPTLPFKRLSRPMYPWDDWNWQP